MATNNTLRSTYTLLPTLVPAAYAVTTNGTSIDLQTFGSKNQRLASVDIAFGAITGTWTPKVQEAPETASGGVGTYADVAAADLIGSFSAVTSANDNTQKSVIYTGTKRYIRVVVTEDVVGTATLAAFVGMLRPEGVL